MKKYLYVLIAGLGFMACEPEFNNPIEDGNVYTSGEADFSNYVAVGNSLTAGYADGALYLQGQQNSYPNIMARQFAFAGGGEFTQPLVNDNLGGLTLSGNVITANRLVLDYSDPANPAPVPLEGTPGTDISEVLTGPFNNMGVPGAKSYHLDLSGYGNIGNFPAAANPYFVRMASSADATVVDDAAAQNPSFFSLWTGNNDILGYATSGGTGIDQTGNINPATYGSNDITDPNVFGVIYNGLLQKLTTNGAKGVVANLPSVTAVPYFTTVPYNPVPLDAATAQQLNAGYSDYNNGLALAQLGNLIDAGEKERRTIKFTAGQNPVVIVDEDLTDLSGLGLPSYRMATASDLLVLTSRTFIGTLVNNDPTKINGISVPLEDQWVLTPEEQEAVTNAQTAYNATISALADQYGLGLVDVNSLLDELKNGGIPFNGGVVTNVYASGGGFSLDGVHPTARGYAVIANEFIKTVNATYGANIPVVDPGAYPTVFIQ